MAALTKAGVTIHDSWNEGGRNNRKYRAHDVTLVLSSQGGLTNNIPAGLFGFTKVKDARGFRDSSSVAVTAGPSFDEAYLVFYTVETNGNPADKTGTYRGIVVGIA
jgi:hypothetical protein